MPYTIRKVTKKPCYRVKNKRTKRVFAKCTSKRRAKKQLRLLRAIQYNKAFVLNRRIRRPRTTRKLRNL